MLHVFLFMYVSICLINRISFSLSVVACVHDRNDILMMHLACGKLFHQIITVKPCNVSNITVKKNNSYNNTLTKHTRSVLFAFNLTDKADFRVIEWVSVQIAQTLISLDDMDLGECVFFCVPFSVVHTQLLNRK